ncbi:MAG: YaaA family protein [Muribaculaceae bacterium]|nr:YaaA family protein [Muribaculaceae bacterium]
MIILIAEAKTMEKDQREISMELFTDRRPEYDGEADRIMQHLMDLPVSEIASAMKVSERMAVNIKEMAYEFPNKAIGRQAIDAFSGIVFKHLDYTGLSERAKENADSNVRIISSVYGWLRPRDIIKPYRMEFSARLAPDDKVVSTFWRRQVTVSLVKTLQTRGETEVLDLLPADAAKCIDWKLVKRFAKVRKVDFTEQNGESVRSPHAGKLKALRGQLLRCILESGMSDINQLRTFQTDDFLPSEPKFPDRIAFMV